MSPAETLAHNASNPLNLNWVVPAEGSEEAYAAAFFCAAVFYVCERNK